MKKRILILIALTLVVPSAQILHGGEPENSPHDQWSLSQWASEGVQNMIIKMERDFNKLKQEFSKISLFGPNITSGYDEKAKHYYVTVELPGYNETDISITVKITGKEKTLMIEAKKQVKKDGESEQKAFKLSQTLPKEAVVNKAKKTYKNGILRIEFPLATKKTKFIKI